MLLGALQNTYLDLVRNGSEVVGLVVCTVWEVKMYIYVAVA